MCELAGVSSSCTETTEGSTGVELCAKDAGVEMAVGNKAEVVVYAFAGEKQRNEIGWRAERSEDGDFETDVLEDVVGESAEERVLVDCL